MTQKHIFRFTLFMLLSCLLILMWLIPVTGEYFNKFDRAVYYFLNGTLKDKNNWQMLWAVTNAHIFDLAEGVFVLVMLLFHMYTKSNLNNNVKPLGRFILFIVFIVISIIVNKIVVLFSLEFIDYHRQSPSLVLDGGIRLSEIITSFEFKDASKDCFPGDHAAILLCSTFYFFIYGNKKVGFVSCFVLLPLILPRLVVGAHWFTDCLIGSTFILINTFNIWINIPMIKDKIQKKLKP